VPIAIAGVAARLSIAALLDAPSTKRPTGAVAA
jgi:hypothetical protein